MLKDHELDLGTFFRSSYQLLRGKLRRVRIDLRRDQIARRLLARCVALTTAMRANVIHVMQRGEIAECGSHDQLVVAGGLYAQSWETQMAGHSSHAAAPLPC